MSGLAALVFALIAALVLRVHREHARIEAQRLFFSTVSHDIRTPLNAILGFTELLMAGQGDAAERASYLQTVSSSGKVLARLVDDILDLSKLEDGKLEIVRTATDVPALVREVAASFEAVRAKTPLTFSVELAEMPRVVVDPQRLRQILYNLLSNAFKYTEKGSIAVRTAWVNETLTLMVSDTGKGIAKENLARILRPFEQVVDNNHRDGTGLGLTICNRLARLMGGALKIESELGHGSTFTVTLHNVPVAEAVDEKAQPSEPAETQVAAPDLQLAKGVKRPLIVDDSPVNVAVLKAILGKCGVKDVLTAANGEAALKVLKAHPEVDVVLSDLWMPTLDGRGLVRAIRTDAALKDLPVILVTADSDAKRTAAEDGFSGVLLKPITSEGVRNLLQRPVCAEGSEDL